MINLFRKGFIYLTLMLLVLCSFSMESASAAEGVDYEEGITNLNNTPENSAVIGDSLLTPEVGWKRYDDKNPALKYTGNWKEDNSLGIYLGSASYTYDLNSTVKFSFKGKSIRLIGYGFTNKTTKGKVEIDGSIEYFNENRSVLPQMLIYEKTGLEDTIHTVEIGLENAQLYIDAIDVDGILLAPGEIPNVQSVTLDRNNLELLEGSQDKLTATVTPDTAKVIWSSSDETIATVDQYGNLTALREGEAIITAKIENTDISATSTVIVKKPINETSSAILSITLVNGITKEYDVTNTVLNNYLNWFDSAQGTSTFKFSKTISPYKKVTEYIVHDKIASFEVREY